MTFITGQSDAHHTFAILFTFFRLDGR